MRPVSLLAVHGCSRREDSVVMTPLAKKQFIFYPMN